MDSDMKTNRPEITVRYDKKSLQKHLIYAVIFIIIALVSFFAISKWATSVDTYSRIINTLNKLQKKALELTGTATALATGAAAIPGDATTPIANKLADVAGYMVIVYAVIIVEKYLLTITGYIAFKILFPIGCVLMATGNFCKAGWKEFIYRIGIKSIILGILLWGLIPTSVWVTNKVNETYAKSYDMDFSLFEDDACVYNFLNGALNVSEVKNTDASVVTIPYSINGLRVTSFQPNVKLPENVSTLIIGANISTFGDSPSSLNWACGNLEEVVVDPRNNDFDSYKGVVYLRANDAYPYFIPAGIRRIELRPMKVMDKNVITMLDKLEEIVIADGTERIEDYAVENCPNLKRVYVPSSVTYISSDAFSKCGDYEIIRTTTGIHNVRL